MAGRGARPRALARNAGVVLGVVFGVVVALAAPLPAVAAAGGHATSRSDAPVAAVGYVDVAAPAMGSRVVAIPVTLSAPAPTRLSLRYAVISGTALVGRDLGRAAGTVVFAMGSTEAFLHVTVLADRAAPAGGCWSDVGDACRTFSVALAPGGADVTVADPAAVDSIVWLTRSGVAVGDAMLSSRDARRTAVIEVPVTLRSPATRTVVVAYRLTAASATAGVEYRGRRGTVRFAPGSDEAAIAVPVLAGAGHQPVEGLAVALVRARGAAIARGTGFALFATPSPGVAMPLARTYAASTLTQVTSSNGRYADHYDVAPTASGTDVSGNGYLIAANDRLLFWPAAEAPTADEMTCATWSSQRPAQASGVPDQQGLMLRARTEDGVTRAITVTKNVFGTGDEYEDLNVHLWNTSHVVPFRLYGHVDLRGYFASSKQRDLPYDVCARVVGTTLQVAFWFANRPPPAWGTTAQGGTFALPSSWDYPGEAGWYAGHLPTGGDVIYANEYAGVPLAAPVP